MLKGFSRKFEPLEVLSSEQLDAIHRGILTVLWRTGITFHHDRVLKLYEKNGCKVDYDQKKVFFPSALVEQCLRTAPETICFEAREPKNTMRVGGNTVYTSDFPGMQILDLHTREPRTATRKEFYDAVKVEDALENLSYLGGISPIYSWQGVPAVMAQIEAFAGRIRNSSKFTRSQYGLDLENFNIMMAKAVGIDIEGYLGASSPLTYYEDAIESTYKYVEAGYSILIGSGPVMGGTSPATNAGSMIAYSAEVIAGLVLVQLLKPGSRVSVSSFLFPQNMRTGHPSFGNVSGFLQQVAFSQIWTRYGVPIHAGAGVSNSKEIDYQSGYEKAIMVLSAALSGAHIIQFMGGVSGELTYHPAQCVIDDDLAGAVGRFIGGFEVSDDTLAIDLINQVGSIPGHYLDKEHTRKWWQKEHFFPKVADTLDYGSWRETGKKNVLSYAQARVDEILTVHKPKPLSADQEQAIEDVLKEARKYYRKNGIISDDEWTDYLRDLKSPNYPYA